ncbi:PREDICTED: complement C1q-like protein 2 isoform X2 [Poecilia mexicana]|uniref:complement C1q-like protein 2 isoform X2 n=1 Tax=Poecilia mexicana TaxID=48701 RepID=UPI00072E1CA9|nr:PREDICTED: complement C1q-like protein 2 isoform X2 [Poecilia mexicana]
MRMKVALVFLPFLLFSSVSMNQMDSDRKISAVHPEKNVHTALAKMAAALAALKSKVSVLEQETEEKGEKLENVTTWREQQKDEISTLKNKIEGQEWKLVQADAHEKDLISLVDKLKQQLNVSGNKVAFSASLLAQGSGITGPVLRDTTLVFKRVVTNIGDAYNPQTGVFTAPLRGAYHFQWYIGVNNGGNTITSLVKNDQQVFTARNNLDSYEYLILGFGSASNGVSLLLEAGDVVFVRLWSGHVIYDDENHICTFSGHLLFPM